MPESTLYRTFQALFGLVPVSFILFHALKHSVSDVETQYFNKGNAVFQAAK